MTINLQDVPQQWRVVVPCHDIVISVVVQSVILRIDAIASEDITEGAVTWPKGDSLASFRIIVPDRYKFVKHKTRNVNCCPLAEGETLPKYDPEDSSWNGNNFNPFGGMIIEPLTPEWGWGLEYDWRPRLEFRLPYRYLDGEKDSNEDYKPVPQWVWPKFKPRF